MAKVRLDRALEKRGMSKRQFAKRLKVPYHYVFRWFKPGYDPKFSRLNQWAKALGCRVRDLFEENKD